MFPSSHCPFRQVPKGSTLATGLEEKLNHATHQERTLMMNKMTEEGAACMYNVQHKHGLPRHTPPPSPHGGVAQEREERKAAAPLHYMLRPQPRQEASHSSPPPSAQSEQEREGGRRRFANVSFYASRFQTCKRDHPRQSKCLDPISCVETSIPSKRVSSNILG